MCHGLFYVMDYLVPVARDVPTYIHTYVQTYIRTYTHTYVRIRGVSGLEVPHVQHIIQYICAAGCRNLHSVHSVQLNSV